MNNIYGIILSGGTGKRMQSPVPKQFLQLGEFPILYHSVKIFKDWGFCKSIVVVSHKDYIEDTEKILSPILEEYDRIVEGGNSRHESTLAGIGSLAKDENDLLLIHDAARPFVTHKELHELADTAIRWGSATLAEKAQETIVNVEENRVNSILNRDSIYMIKTPQAIHTSLLKLLDKTELEEEPTDLCSWVNYVGVRPGIVISNPFNIKITKQSDLQIAESYYPLFQNWK